MAITVKNYYYVQITGIPSNSFLEDRFARKKSERALMGIPAGPAAVFAMVKHLPQSGIDRAKALVGKETQRKAKKTHLFISARFFHKQYYEKKRKALTNSAQEK